MTAAFPPRQSRSVSDHDGDIHAWARRQEAALMEGRPADLDFPHLAQELVALGRSEYRALESALLRLLQHLLKWDHQPSRGCRSWSLTSAVQRRDVDRVLRENHSLVGRRDEAMQSAHRKGRAAMLRETTLARPPSRKATLTPGTT